MNKDKAIQLLERLQDPEPYEPMLTKDAYDAIQMAIDALSADGDTISRQAAIDALKRKQDDGKGDLSRFYNTIIQHDIEAIMQLPPANCSEFPNNSDTISRQAAIDSIEKHLRFGDELYPLTDTDKVLNHGFEIAASCVYNLPSAQPDTEKICARIKAEAIKRNVEYMKHGDRYMLGFVDGMRLARRIVDGTIDDPVYFTLSGE